MQFTENQNSILAVVSQSYLISLGISQKTWGNQVHTVGKASAKLRGQVLALNSLGRLGAHKAGLYGLLISIRAIYAGPLGMAIYTVAFCAYRLISAEFTLVGHGVMLHIAAMALHRFE